MKHNIKKAKGSALVVALLAAMAISITSASLLHQVITESRATEREVAAQQAYYLANAAVERAIYELAYGEDILDDNGNSGSNGLPDLYEQLHGLNSFSTAYGGPGPYINPPLVVTFNIAGRTTTVELVSILPQHQNMLETFDPSKSDDAYLPLLGSCYGKPIFEDLNNDGIPEVLVGTDQGEIRYYNYVQEGNTFVLKEKLVNGNPYITGLDGKLIGNLISSDIDSDNNEDIIFNTDKGHVYRYEVDPNTGELILQWDYDIPSANTTYWELATGNLDNDAELEIVVPAANAGLALLDTDGTPIMTIPRTGFGYHSPPLVGDFDKDGVNEIVADDGVQLNCYELDGTKKWTYRVGLKVDGTTGALLTNNQGRHINDSYSGTFWMTSPTMGDLDGDGYPEIVTTSHGSGAIATRNTHTVVLRDTNRTIVDIQDLNNNNDITDVIYVPDDVRVNLTPSAVANGFSDKLYEMHSHRQPTIGDWNNDGISEIFHGVCIDQVYMFNVDFDNTDGTFFDTPATETDAEWTKGSFQLGDYTGDGNPNFPAGIGGSGDVHASPIFINVDQDPEKEIIFATMNGSGVGGSIIVLDNTIDPNTGKLNVWRQIQFPSTESFHSGVAVADLNNDGIEELILASSSHGSFGGQHYIYALGLRGIKFARTMITATSPGGSDVNKQVRTVVDLGNPAVANPVITFQSWQE